MSAIAVADIPISTEFHKNRYDCTEVCVFSIPYTCMQEAISLLPFYSIFCQSFLYGLGTYSSRYTSIGIYVAYVAWLSFDVTVMSCKNSPASRSEKIRIYSDITCRNAFTFISMRSFSMISLIVQSGELTYDASMFAGRLTADTHLSTFSRASKMHICIDSTCKSAFHRCKTKSITPVSTSVRLILTSHRR